MLHLILADEDLLTTLGRIAALVLVIYVFLFAIFFFVGSLLLLYANAWVRNKVGLLHQLRSIVESIDITIHTPPNESLPSNLEPDSRFGQALQAIHTAQSVQVVEKAKNTQKQVNNIEKKVEPVADRIADGAIEFRARIVMAQSMLKAFFLPGMVKQPSGRLLLPEAVDSGKSIPAEVTVEGSSSHDGSSNVVVTQVDPSDGNVQITTIRESKRSENEGTE
jgi:HAMP domain-containing protein